MPYFVNVLVDAPGFVNEPHHTHISLAARITCPMQMDAKLRGCYSVLLAIAVLSSYVDVPTALVTVPTFIAIVYIGAMVSLDITQHMSKEGNTDVSAQRDASQGQRPQRMSLFDRRVLLFASISSVVISRVFDVDFANAFAPQVAVPVYMYYFMGAFAPIVVDVLENVMDRRVFQRNISFPLWGSVDIEWSWLRVATTTIALVLSVALGSTKHVVLNNVFAIAMIITMTLEDHSVLKMRGAVAMVKLVCKSMGLNTLLHTLEALDQATNIALPLAAGRASAEDDSAFAHTAEVAFTGLFVSSALSADYLAACKRNDQVRIKSFSKPLFHLSLLIFVTGQIIIEIATLVVHVPQKLTLMVSVVALSIAVVDHGRFWMSVRAALRLNEDLHVDSEHLEKKEH